MRMFTPFIWCQRFRDLLHAFLPTTSCALKCDENQTKRIQRGESIATSSILFYELLGSCVKMADYAQKFLNIFRIPFRKTVSREIQILEDLSD